VSVSSVDPRRSHESLTAFAAPGGILRPRDLFRLSSVHPDPIASLASDSRGVNEFDLAHNPALIVLIE